MIKKNKSSLFTKIFIVTFLLTSLCCMITYGVISWLIPKTYSTTLDASLDSAVNSLLTEVENLTPMESGKLIDEFVINQNGVLIQLFDSSNRAIELPSQNSTTFPAFVTGGVAIESDDPAAYRATHSYIFTFADSDDVYTLTVAGSAQEVNLLKDTLGGIFIILLFVILLVAVLASIVYSHYVTRPVLRISRVSKRMAELDFSWRCEENRTDELGTLAHSLNEMSQKLSASMTDLKCANEKLQADIERERALEQAQLDFFSAVSHELKTPIALIQGYAEGLTEGMAEDPESRDYYCEVIQDEAGKMNKMVKQLLTLTALEFGNDKPVMEQFDLVTLISGVLSSAKILLQQKEAQVIFDASEPVMVWADEFKIEEVVTNYLNNAMNHLDGEKRIEIRIEKNDKEVKVTVFNTGQNIPEEDLGKLWTKFYKVDKARTRAYGGSGIGLSIVKAIMDSHNKACGVQNVKDGVEFWFTLDCSI